MKVLGTATALATGTTKFTTATSVYVFNTSTASLVTVRNADDDGDIGSVYIPAGGGQVIHLEIGQGLRGATTLFGTHISSTGY